jgi:hypothetical protein
VAAKTAAAAVKRAAAVPKAAIAAPVAPAAPTDAVGDGSQFETLDTKPQADPTP